jgi:hypothetical protein
MLRFGRVLALCAALVAPGAMAADHLTPSTGSPVLASYQTTVREALAAAFLPNVRVRVIGEPSFQPEFAVGIRERGGRYWIFALQPRQQLWGYSVLEMANRGEIQWLNRERGAPDPMKELRDSLPPTPRDVKIDRCEAPIDADLAGEVIQSWARMLDGVRPERSSGFGVDGETYDFSMERDGRTLTGSTWSPDPATPPGLLVLMVAEMRNYCRMNDAARLKGLRESSSALSRRLAAESP